MKRTESTESKPFSLKKRALSFLLCLALLCVFPGAFAAKAAEAYDLEYPIVYVIGRQKIRTRSSTR